MAVTASSITHLLHHFLRRTPQSHLPALSFKPLFTSSIANSIFSNPLKTPIFKTQFNALNTELNSDFDTELDVESENLELEDEISDGVGVVSDDSVTEGLMKSGNVKVPDLTVKEKKELASYAHGLGKKLKCQLVGKSGVTHNVVASFIETLEANELLKIKIHRTCPGELEDVVQHLEEATGSVVVGQIGRTVIIYRPSLTKLKIEEKKRQNRRIYVRPEAKLSPMSRLRSMPREQMQRSSGSGQRGYSRHKVQS